MDKRVVITGLGAVTPIGLNVEEFWQAIHDEKTGFSLIEGVNVSKNKCRVAAQIKNFDPLKYMDEKSAGRSERFVQLAIAASDEAVKDAGLIMENEDPFRVGCSIASALGSMSAFEKEHTSYMQKGPRAINPFFIPTMISNMAAGNVCIRHGIMGKSINVVTACAAGTNSIGEACRAIQYGEADVMLAGGSDSCITEMGLSGFEALKAMSVSRDVNRCSIPFDKDRSGFIMGEGSGIIVLEDYDHAVKRGAHIYAEIAGYGCSSDAYHITSPRQDGEGAARAMQNAVEDAGITIDDITYINAHGTSTKYNDLFETRAIKKCFGDRAAALKVNSTKSMTGHLFGAAGAIEAVVCVKSLQEGFIHKTVGLCETEEEMDLDYCKETYKMDFDYAMSNSLGFGGHNASIIIKKAL